MAVDVFLDTSVLLAGLVDFGPQSGPAQSVMHAVAEKRRPRQRRRGTVASNSFLSPHDSPLNTGLPRPTRPTSFRRRSSNG